MFPDYPMAFWLCAVPAVLLFGISKVGFGSGFISTLAHAGGPPVAMCLLRQKLERSLFVGTTVIYFAALNLIKLLPYGILGLLHAGDTRAILFFGSPDLHRGQAWDQPE